MDFIRAILAESPSAKINNKDLMIKQTLNGYHITAYVSEGGRSIEKEFSAVSLDQLLQIIFAFYQQEQ